MKVSFAIKTLPCLAAVALVGCGGGDSHGPRVVTRDSAGVEIVENRAPEGTVPRWDLVPLPLVDIGRREGDDVYLLNRVVAAFRLGSGEYVVANGGSAEFRFYDQGGTFIRSAGGRGGGPGELHRLHDVSVLEGDTLAAFDPYAGQLDFFGPSGVFIRRSTLNLRGLFTPPITLEPFGTHLLPDRTILVQADLPSGERSSTAATDRKRMAFEQFDPSSGVRDSLGMFLGFENYGIEIGGRMFYDGPPAPRQTVVTVGPRFVYIADTDKYEIFAFDILSGERWSIRRDRPGPPFTTEDRTAFETSYRERMGRTPVPTEDQERWLAAVPSPDTWPPIQSLRADRLGRLWVEQPPTQKGDPPVWAVFDTEGRLVAETTLPQSFTPLDIGPNYVLGVWRDEDNVEYVHVYGLTTR